MLDNLKSDDQLMRNVAQGDTNSFTVLFNRHSGKALGYAQRLLGGDADMAEDICQNIWIKVVQKSDTYIGKGTFIAWIYTMIRNAVFDEFRRKKEVFCNNAMDEENPLASSFENSLEFSRASFEEEIIENSDIVMIKRAIDDLPEMQRVVLSIWLIEDMSYEEIAVKINQSVPAVKSLLFRAKQSLKDLVGGNP